MPQQPATTQRHHDAQANLAAVIAVLQEEQRRLADLAASDEAIRDLQHLTAGAREGLVLMAIAHGQRESAAHAALSQRIASHLS
jgi:hypothetical protein